MTPKSSPRHFNTDVLTVNLNHRTLTIIELMSLILSSIIAIAATKAGRGYCLDTEHLQSKLSRVLKLSTIV